MNSQQHCSVPEHFIDTASLIEEKSGGSLFVIHSTHYTNLLDMRRGHYGAGNQILT
jgi:hypothetical protein